MRAFLIAGLALASCGPAPKAKAPAAAPLADLIPRAALFGAPEAMDARLSDDGTQIAYLTLKDGAYTLVVAQAADLLDTKELAAGVIEPPAWAGTNVVYRTVKEYRVVDPKTEDSDIALTGVREAQFVAANAKDAVFRYGGDFAALELRRDAQTTLLHARDGFADVLMNAVDRPVVGVKANGEVWGLGAKSRKLVALSEPTLKRVSPDGKAIFVTAANGERRAMFRIDLASGAAQIVAQNPSVDVTDFFLDKSGAVAAVKSEGLVRQWTAMTPAGKVELETLRQTVTSDFSIASRSADDMHWIVEEQGPAQPMRAWLYDRAKKSVDRLFIEHPAMDQRPLAPMRVVQIPGRGKYVLPAYVTVNGKGAKPLVLIANVTRDHLDYDPLAQMFADRGYAVLELQTRGKAGFGKTFAALGQADSAKAINEDIADAARWAVMQRIATPGKIAVIGEGVGGAGAIATLGAPKAYRCAVSIDPPLAQAAVARIGAPLLLVRRSTRAPAAAGEALVAALKAAKKPVAYALYRDGGESFATPAERISFAALSSAFLSKCLATRPDPIGPDFRGSSLQIVEGGALIPGLADALAPRDADLGAPP